MKYRLAKLTDCAQMASVALACKGELNHEITFQLGSRFLREYYRMVLEEKGTAALAAVDEDKPDSVLGFAFGSLDAAESMRSFRKHRFRLALAALPAILCRPRLMFALLARYRATAEKSPHQYVVRSGARLTFIAMLPEARTAVDGIVLLRQWLALMRVLGAREIRLEVDVKNTRAVELHQILGATVIKEFATPGRSTRVFMEYAAKKSSAARR